MDPQTMRDRFLARVNRNRLVGSFSIANAEGDGPAVLRLYGDIGWSFWGGIDEESVARELDNVTADEIEVQISSDGGDVFAGIAIFNAMRAHAARITTRVDGLAASIASVIVQAGEHRTMLTGSQQMIHRAWGLAIGDDRDMHQFGDLLERQTLNIADIYAERSGRPAADFAALLDGPDYWMNAQEAVDEGLADEVVNPSAAGQTEDSARHSVAGVGSRQPAGGTNNQGDLPTPAADPAEEQPVNAHPDAERILRHHDLGRRVRARATGNTTEGVNSANSDE